MNKLLNEYKSKLREIKRLQGISALLSWDQENQMPEKAIQSRSEEIAYISKISHEKFTDKKFIEIVNELFENTEKLTPLEARSVALLRRDLDKLTKIPTTFVEEFSKLRSMSQAKWIESKTREDYSIFKPYLKQIIDYSREYANYIDNTKPIYDVLLDDYEEGMTTAKLQKVFLDLKLELVDLLKKIPTRKDNLTLSSQTFNKDTTRKLLIEMTSKIGFDYSRGALGEVHHPFETTLSENDIRINVAYPQKDIGFSITGAIHEAGHGLYEQNIDPKYYETSLSQGVSLGIHESQSRLLENMIGRSEAFWIYFLPIIKKYYPSLNDLRVEEVVRDLNRVSPSFIRTEADEVTYNLHIILRFELEQKLLNSELSTDDLPEAWNSAMKDLLGLTPSKPSLGCLQDVHWSMGNLGYFPTYSLGNLNAGQLWNTFITENKKWESEISKGDFSTYFNWFKEKIWQHGSYYKPDQLLIMATGEDLNAKYFVNYLKSKYLD